MVNNVNNNSNNKNNKNNNNNNNNNNRFQMGMLWRNYMVPIAADRYNIEQWILKMFIVFERKLHFESCHIEASIEKYTSNLHLIGPSLAWILLDSLIYYQVKHYNFC